MSDRHPNRLPTHGRLLLAVGVVLLALNLRPAAVSIGPLLDEIRDGLSMGPVAAGLLTTLPVLCFAVFGWLAPGFARRLGIHRVMLTALFVTAVGLLVRSGAGSTPVFLLATVPALAGMATANVLLPSLVKHDFPDRIGSMTAVYTTALAVGLTAGSVLSVPIADAEGSWRGGLVSWAALAVLALVPWLGLVRRDSGAPEPPAATAEPAPDAPERGRTISGWTVARTPLGLTMMVFFGLQSLQAYSVFGWLPQIFRDAGFSASSAGLLLGVTTATSIPMSLVLPGLAVRGRHTGAIMVTLCAAYVTGYLGLILDATTMPWLWALLIGIGAGIFPLVLTLIGLRARTSEGTAALSGFTQSLGYLIAGAGPFMMGALYGATGSWTVPLTVLIVLVAPQLVTGLMVVRDRYLEDELPT